MNVNQMMKKLKKIHLIIFLLFLTISSLDSINFQKVKPNLNCKFKPGYYIETIHFGENTLVIHVEITEELINFHRVIDQLYVKNKLVWTGDCEFEMVTLEITDPILLDSDWIGKRTNYKAVAIDNNIYNYIKIEKNATSQTLKFQGKSFPQ
ncbi:hypothetical protein [Leptospira kanakyensis]|uniref:hypothetical protein n=1 Tax=Leptospira kanakyensis TaxID=2484968 RepID=UPI00223DD223|nr:hypothetical protein [Leptospira kanakyensis]MCW7470333.1 hypothetical protein [Leptospira kanakyensis]